MKDHFTLLITASYLKADLVMDKIRQKKEIIKSVLLRI